MLGILIGIAVGVVVGASAMYLIIKWAFNQLG